MRNVPHRPGHAGFTLIEIVIVMAIIAILALMALPSLYGVTARQQIKDSDTLVNIGRNAVTSYYYAHGGEMPADNEAAGIPPSKKLLGNYVSDVAIKDGAVTVTYGNNCHSKIKGKRLTWRPFYVKEASIVQLAWLCGGRAVPSGATVVGTNVTDVPVDSLPLDCR